MINFFATLRFRIMLIVFFAVLPALTLALYNGFEQRQMAAQQAREDLVQLAQRAAHDQKSLINETHHLLISLAERQLVQNGSPAECSALLASMLPQYDHYINLGVIDLGGQLWCSAVPSPGAVNVADRGYFQRVLQTGDFVIGEFQTGRVTGKASVNLAYPVRDLKGNLRGAIFASLNLGWLNSLASTTGLPKGSTLTMVDDKNVILARHPNPDQWVGKSMPETATIRSLLQRGGGVAEATGIDGGQRLYASVPVGNTGCAAMIYAGIPLHGIYAEPNRILLRNLAALTLVSLLALTGAWLFGHLFIMRKMDVLVDAAGQLAAGNFSVRAAQVDDQGEIGRLARAFNEMAAGLQGRELEREHMEIELRRSEAEFRTLVEQVPAITYKAALDDVSTTLYVSPQVETLLGYNHSDYLADPDIWRKKLHPADRDRVMAEVLRCHANHEPFVCEYRMLAKDGREVWLQDNAWVVRDETGQPLSLQGVMLDVSEQKRTAQALRESEQMAAVILGNISDAVLVTDDAGAFRYISPSASAIFRRSLEEIKELGAVTQLLGNEIFAPEEVGKIDEIHNIEREFTDRDGTRHVLLINAKAAPISGGTRLYTCRDITRRKEMEEALRRAHDELETRVRERTAELAQKNTELSAEIAERQRVEEALQKTLEKLKFFAYSVMHDLKSPAVAIYGLTRLLRKQSSAVFDEKSTLFCDQIMTAAEHVAALVEQINLYISAKEAPLKIEQVDVHQVLKTIHDEFSSRLNTRRIQWLEPTGPLPVDADRLALLRVFRNFVDNALKYGGEQLSRISIGYESTATAHIFSIRDDGIGVQSDDPAKLFELFHRQQAAHGTEGSGLGLAIVREIIERHGGKVWMEPAAERGTCFCFSLLKNQTESAPA